jgi:ADP-heptose:LPS heptosyltransferase
VGLGGVGDVARILPAAARLRAAWPGAHLAWLVEPAGAGLVAGQPWIDEVLVFPRTLASCLRALRGRRFDLVVDFHAVLRSALLGLASGAARRASHAPPFARELAWAFATDRARIAPARVNRFERNEALVRFLGAAAEPCVVPLRVEPAAARRLREALGPGPAPIALHPGTSDATAQERFPPALFAEAARALRVELGLGTLVTWGPARDDRALAEAIVAAAPGAARLAPATPALSDLAALFAACRLVVAPDGGPLHVASLVGTPVVQLLGTTDAVENAPWPATPSRTLRGWPGAAAKSGGRGRGIAPEAIVEAARELLAQRGGEGGDPERNTGRASEHPG